MKCGGKFESRKKRVLNIIELGELVYIRLDDGKKYLLNGDGCWRCGSTAKCFGNMEGNELEVICEFGFFDEVRSLFLLLVKERAVRLASWLSDRMSGNSWAFIEKALDSLGRVIEYVNMKSCAGNFF